MGPTDAKPTVPPSVSVVVPVFNGALSLEELVDRTAAVLRKRGAPYELLLVNDGSRDDSWDVIVRLAAGSPDVRGIDLTRNFGQHNALLAGIRCARHQRIVTLDDDLQQPPEEIPKLLDELEAGADVVYGTPVLPNRSLGRRFAARLLRLVLSRLLGSETAKYSNTFCAFRTEIRDAFADYRGAFVTIDALLTWGAARTSQVPVEHAPRQHGTSNYSAGKLVRQAFNTVTNFSVRPLRFASVLGFAFTLLGMVGMAYTVGFHKWRGLPIPPDSFVFAVVCLFAGIQLFTLGIIGEYLSQVHLRTMDRPPYTIRRDTDREG